MKMETAASNDPYELKLYQMFQSCDVDSCGFLDEHSLRRLCSLLELRDKGAVLIENLTASDIKPRVTFELFKEELLNFLGTELDDNNVGLTEEQQQQQQAAVAKSTTAGTTATTTTIKQKQSNLDDDTRAINDAHSLVLHDDVSTYIESPPDSSDREVSPKLVVGTKKYGRRSRPPSHIFDDFSQSDSDNDINGRDNDSHRNCDANCFTSNKLVHRSSSQTDIPGSRRRRPLPMNGNRLKRCASLPAQQNMQGFGKTLKKTTALTTAAMSQHKNAQTIQNLMVPLQQDHNSSLESIDAPIGIETLPANSIVDIWERANINNSRGLLLALGFDENEINVEQLNKVLEEELRNLDDDQNSMVPRALLALQSGEMATLRQTLRQLKAENKKLRTDNKDANQRIAMMATEIDERHASLEDATKKEIRLLEQKHASIVRDLTTRMTNDRENWTNLSARLEARIKIFEQDEIKMKADLESLRKENNEMENEQQKLQKQVTELLEKNIKLNREIADLVDNNSNLRVCEEQQHRFNDDISKFKNHVVDDDDDTDEVLRLMDKITTLQMENTNLRDKNDELVTELENLNIELTRVKLKHKKSNNVMAISVTTEANADDIQSAEEAELGSGTTGTKRRGDSPSKTRISEESPRMGKLRKYTNDITTSGTSENSDTSGEWVALNSELQQSSLDEKGSQQQQQKTDSTTATNEAGAAAAAKKEDVNEKIMQLKRKIKTLEEELQKAKETTADDRCKELETSLEQMQRAYEDCEDYWQGKLSDERQLFEKERQIYEDEQQESDKKFTELMEKVREYEEQFSRDGRLSPIEEKYSLEQQYADLEAEVEEVRENAQKIWEEKSKEIEMLQAEIEDLRIRLGESVEILTGATELQQNSEANKFERNEHLSAASSPISYLWHQSTIQEPAKNYQSLENSMMSTSTPTPLSPTKQRSLTTSETTIFSTTPVNIEPTTATSTSLLPIQKPTSAIITTTTTTTTTTTANTSIASKTQSEGEVADCETSSTASGKSFETHSVDTSSTSGGVSVGAGGGAAATLHHQQHKTKLHSSQENVSASSIKEELKRLKFFEISLKDQIKDLSLQRDGLVMELQQLHEAKPVLEKAYARAAHPTLIQRVNQLELKNRHLQNVIKQQQNYTETIMQQTWRQHQIELGELHNRIETQNVMIADQVQRLQNADIMVKDLYVENSHLTATIQRMEQQRARVSMQTQQQQQHQQQQLLQPNNNYNVRI